MRLKQTIRNILILIFLATNIGCDQITKHIVRERIEYNQSTALLGNFITLTKVENTGAFLGMGDQLPRIVYKILMIFLPLIVLGYALWYLFTGKNISRLLIFALCMVIGGGLGNIYDRILYASVTDFLHFDFVIFQTGIVNMADISLTTGFFILVYISFINKGSLTVPPSQKSTAGLFSNSGNA